MEKFSRNFNSTINSTGYRLLLILQLLMQGPTSKEDIIRSVGENEYVKEISQDTIRLDVNTLRNAGFNIVNSIADDKYVYVLKSNPLEIKLTKEDLKTLERIKKIALELWSWENIISLYETFEKISHFIQNEEYKSSILNFGYFMQIDFNLLKELHSYCLKNSEITLKYNSPKNGIMSVRMRVIGIEQDKNTGKLHIFGYFEHYNYISYLRVDKIIKVESVFLKPTIKLIEKKYKTYKVKPTQNFEPSFNEEIVEETSDYIKIKATIINDFRYVQRILTLGDSVLEVDKKTKKQIVEDLIKTRKVYEKCQQG